MRGHRHGGGWLLRISDLEHDQSGVTAGERTAVAVAVAVAVDVAAVDVAAVAVAAAGVKSHQFFYHASRGVER
jgi:hypothetical protein